MTKNKTITRILYILLTLALIALGVFWWMSNNKETDKKSLPDDTEKQEVQAKTAEVINFGSWQPSNYRKILGTVVASNETNITSNLSGNIAQVFVEIGDKVYEGEILAKFSRENDLSQISYENALNSLQNTKLSAQNSIRSAEISLENAKRDLEQARETAGQNKNQTFIALRTLAKNSETTISNGLNWADKTLGVSKTFRYSVSPAASQIGMNNSIMKNNTKNLISDLVREFSLIENLAEFEKDNESKILAFAQKRNYFLGQIQTVARNIDQLIRQTPTSSSFAENLKAQLLAETEGNSAKIDGAIAGLQAQIEAAKSAEKQIESSILGAENRVKNAESALEMAQSGAQLQVAGSQSQVNIAHKSLKDLQVKAPFGGKISAKFVNDFDRVAPGQNLFSLTALDESPEVVAYLSAEEAAVIKDQEKIKIGLPNGDEETPDGVFVSGKLDQTTQKMEVKFRGNFGKLLAGSIVDVLVPIASEGGNIVPISAVSFEPDGAEVFIINSIKKVERRKVQTGKIVANAVEIVSGLEAGEKIIQYRNRVNAGDLVQLKVDN